MKADLHIHSLYSNDGELGIPEILKKCHESGVDTISITDHNCVRGTREAARLTAEDHGIDFIPGIEIDCNYMGTDLHLLGYQVDLRGGDFDALEKSVRKKYMDAVPQMISNLERLGIGIDPDELMNRSGGEPPTGELFAELLLEHPDQHSNPRLKPYLPGGKRSDMPLINFYLDFFAQGKPAYVKIDHLDFKDAVALVRNNGGIPIVAHPGLNLEGREEVVNDLMDLGSAGIEVFNNYHSNKQVAYFAGATSKRGALMTCGSDFHGKNKPLISIGQYSFLESYREYLERSLTTILELVQDKPNL
ncbi:MAG: PHP domain-containing protein [Bacteroidales bacterium]|nr:PHP domain-containing protein [Bacteroidales bacterium]